MSNVAVKLFKATWCGHCNAFKPEWENLKKDCDEMGIKADALDADADRAEVDKENIKGFPTIKIYVDGQGTEYEGQRSASAIMSEIMKLKGQGSRPTLRGGSRNQNYYHQYRKYKGKYLKLKDYVGY